MSYVLAVAAEVLPPELRGMPPAALMQMLPPEVSRQLVDRAITERALVGSDDPVVPVGIDGESVHLSTPVRCTVRPAAVRVRLEKDPGEGDDR